MSRPVQRAGTKARGMLSSFLGGGAMRLLPFFLHARPSAKKRHVLPRRLTVSARAQDRPLAGRSKTDRASVRSTVTRPLVHADHVPGQHSRMTSRVRRRPATVTLSCWRRQLRVSRSPGHALAANPPREINARPKKGKAGRTVRGHFGFSSEKFLP